MLNRFIYVYFIRVINPLNAELYPISHLLALLGAHPILHVSRIRVNILISCFFTQVHFLNNYLCYLFPMFAFYVINHIC